MDFARVYAARVAKAERKGREKAMVGLLRLGALDLRAISRAVDAADDAAVLRVTGSRMEDSFLGGEGAPWSTFTMTTWLFREMQVEMPKGIEQSEVAQGASPSRANVTYTLESR